MYRHLDADQVLAAIDEPNRRILERFPNCGLCRVCGELLNTASESKEQSTWIGKPLLGLRIATGSLIALILGVLVFGLIELDSPSGTLELTEIIQIFEAGINDLVLIGAAIFFLITIENRVKRQRVLDALHALRSLAHVIDMHQLTKDPEQVIHNQNNTPSSPHREAMTKFELGRYLDYCSEMLSLTGKLAALTIQNFDDPVALASVNELENLTTGLSRKVWQKIMILQSIEEEE